MLFDLSSTIIALHNQRLGFEQVRLDGPVAQSPAGRAVTARSTDAGRRWRFEWLSARTA